MVLLVVSGKRGVREVRGREKGKHNVEVRGLWPIVGPLGSYTRHDTILGYLFNYLILELLKYFGCLKARRQP